MFSGDYVGEKDYKYKMFMKALNLEIPFSELHNGFGYNEGSYGDEELIESISHMYNIYYLDKPLIKRWFDIYMKYVNKEISLYEYLEQFEQLDLDKSSYITIVFNYAKKVENMSKNEIKKMREKSNFYKNVLEYILNISSEKEIFELLTVYGKYKSKGIYYGNVQLNTLINHIYTFVRLKYGNNISDDERDKIVNDLKEKVHNVLKIYSDLKKEEDSNRKREEKEQCLNEILVKSINLINNYMISNLNKKQFLEKYNISKKDFDKALESIKNNEPELFQQYKDYNNKLQSERFAVVSNKCNIIIDQIKNGVINEETNEKRDFDILDYYMYTNLTPEEYINIIKENYNGTDIRDVKRFFAKYNSKIDETKMIREMKFIINSIEVTEEEKEMIINYLNSINAPINIKIFRLALKKYFNSELPIEKGKIKKREM